MYLASSYCYRPQEPARARPFVRSVLAEGLASAVRSGVYMHIYAYTCVHMSIYICVLTRLNIYRPHTTIYPASASYSYKSSVLILLARAQAYDRSRPQLFEGVLSLTWLQLARRLKHRASSLTFGATAGDVHQIVDSRVAAPFPAFEHYSRYSLYLLCWYKGTHTDT